MALLAIIALFLLYISHRSLLRRVVFLEAKLKGEPKDVQLEAATAQPGVSVSAASQAAAPLSAPASLQGTPAAASEPAVPHTAIESRFGAWLKEDWLMKLGALLFIIGCGWFVSYAFANNWIGPVGRITIGIVTGVLIMMLGYWRMMRFPSQGAVFLALGAGTTMLTIFAGRAIYEFFTPISALGFDLLIAAFVSFASYKFNTRSLAMSAQVLAFVAPLLTAGTTDSFILFSYLFLISLATLVLAGATGWRDLIVSSLIFVGLYSIPYVMGSGSYYGTSRADEASFLLNFAYLFSLMYLLVGMVAVVKRGIESAKNEVLLAVLNGLFLFAWIYNVAATEWRSLLFAAWAIVFTIGSFIAYRYTSKLHPFFAYGSVAVAFIAAATAAQLDGPALTIAFTIEVLVLVITVIALTRNVHAAITTSALFLGPGILSVSSFMGYMQSEQLFNQDFTVLAILAVCLIAAGRIIGRAAVDFKVEDAKDASAALVVIGTVYIWVTLWGFMHVLLADTPDMATAVTLFIYTLAGLIAYFAGLYGNDIARRIYGTALLGFVVVRLMFIDVWDMELFGRVITFFAIGILLMSTAFFTKKKKHIEVPAVSNAQ